MKPILLVLLSCVLTLSAQRISASSGVLEGVYPAGYLDAVCGYRLCKNTQVVQGRGAFIKASEKARRIARRLDRSGYYSHYSRALKGYPHLRSKKNVGRRRGSPGFNAANRKRLRPLVVKVAKTNRLDPKLLDAVIVVESGYEPEAVSPKGAQGLMQLMPATAERFDVTDPFNPSANIGGGARYLRWLMDRFENDLELALAAYNAGEGALARHGGTIPPYAETRSYVDRVLTLYKASKR